MFWLLSASDLEMHAEINLLISNVYIIVVRIHFFPGEIKNLLCINFIHLVIVTLVFCIFLICGFVMLSWLIWTI